MTSHTLAYPPQGSAAQVPTPAEMVLARMSASWGAISITTQHLHEPSSLNAMSFLKQLGKPGIVGIELNSAVSE
jgi:hypothetical protein